jgi:DNA-binding IclR family transcriptional regulator
MRRDMVVQDAATGHYDLGVMALRLGLSALNRLDVIAVAEEELRRLVAKTEETGMLSIWGDRGPIAIRWRRGRTLILASIGVGTTFSLLGTATGHVFLAYMQPSISRRVLEAERADLTARRKAVSDAQIAAITARIRKAGHATEDSHLVEGIRAISAPIFDFQGELVAAITLVGTSLGRRAKSDRALAELLHACAAIARRLGSVAAADQPARRSSPPEKKRAVTRST